MAMISCPECQRPQVSDRAEKCPTCGYPIAKYADRPPAPPSVQVTHVRHEEVNRGFTKGVDQAMADVGTGAAKFVLGAVAVGIVLLGLYGYNLMLCPACKGSGKNLLLFKCGTCSGSGWKR
ncbi:MAG: hypothetical protein WCL32_15395 [Planctomycetota bacterium]